MKMTALRETMKHAGMTDCEHECERADECPVDHANALRILLDRFSMSMDDETHVLSVLAMESVLRLASPAQQAMYLKKLAEAFTGMTMSVALLQAEQMKVEQPAPSIDEGNEGG